MKFPKIKFITEQKDDKDIIEVKKSDLVCFEENLHDISSKKFSGGVWLSVEIREDGILAGKALYIETANASPQLVIDDEGATCLIFIKKQP